MIVHFIAFCVGDTERLGFTYLSGVGTVWVTCHTHHTYLPAAM
jgi:hypothetical protein